jgi:hypothetical protein
MASNFAFHPTVNEVVPYSAQYRFPSQATRQSKRTIKLTPKNNAAIYSSGSVIRFEFPASGYLNPNTTYLAFNCRAVNTSGTAFAAGTSATGGFEFQNGIQSILRRVRVLYGSLVLEDIQDYNIVQRVFLETVMPTGSYTSSQGMTQGIGIAKRSVNIVTSSLAANLLPSPYHQNFIRTNYHSTGTESAPLNVGNTTRRYMIPINTGLFQQHNLIPLKFMASQLSIELEIADAIDCQIWTLGVGGSPAVPSSAKVEVGLPELVSELLEFDSDFDKAVFNIMGKGLPIYFQSYHVTTQNVTPNTRVQLNIQESARSVRYALAVMMDDTDRSLRRDTHRFIASLLTSQVDAIASDTGITNNIQDNALESYQWRLGGTYYPSQPVPCYSTAFPNITGVDANYSDPPVEAYAEVMKVFGNLFQDDGTMFGDQSINFFGEIRKGTLTGNGFGANSFVMAGNFMSDRGDIISGINAEEQNDLQLIITFVGTATNPSGTPSTKTAKIITCFDNLIILGESNNMVHVY